MSGKSEDGDCVHQHPQAAGVATVTRQAAIAVFPFWILRKQTFVELESGKLNDHFITHQPSSHAPGAYIYAVQLQIFVALMICEFDKKIFAL